MNLTGALANDNKPKSTEKSVSKAAENVKMEPEQSEQQPTKSTGAIPLPYTSNTNIDDNHNNNTNTTSPTPSTTINEDKSNEGDGVRAPKRGRHKSLPLAEEMLVSPPQKKPANEVNEGMEATAMVEMASKLTKCQKMNATLRMTLWKSFPSAHLCYYMKIPALGYLYVNPAGFLRSSGNPQQPFPCAGYFQFTKHSDGSFSIYSTLKGKYLQKHPTSSLSTFVYFAADECGTADTKFVLFFHQQDEQPGFMVDIHSLANDSYLAKQQNGNFIEVTSCTAPANKFLIIPVLDGQ